MGTKGALRTPTRLGRISHNHLDTQLTQGAAELRQLRLVHFADRHRREPIVAPAVGIERSEQAVALNRLTHTTKAARYAFLFDEEHAVVFFCGIVHRHNQVPEMAGDPFMRAAVLMQEHSRHRRTFPTLAVCATLRQLGNHPSGLQPVLYPCVASMQGLPPVAARTVVLAPIPTMKMLDVPTLILRAVQHH